MSALVSNTVSKADSGSVSIKLIQCSKTFGNGAPALEPIDLEVHPGETLVLLGPSGCGKTTTLRMIAGLEFPDAGGRILFGDEDVTDLPIERRGVGMVFQSYALFPNMTVGENIAYGLRIRGIAAAERLTRIDDLLELVQLQGFAQRRIDQLSGGQKQRVALARALAVEPRVLLLDEPLTALDAKLRESLRADLNSLLRKLGITAIYVTHDQGEAMALGDRIVVMERGRIAQIGSPQEIYYQPANLFVADFIGNMNRISGAVQDGQLQTVAGTLALPEQQTPLQHGAQATAMFRPEDVQLAVPDGSGEGLDGCIMSSFFMGDRTRLMIDVGQALPIIVDASGRVSWHAGERVNLRIAPQAMLGVLPSPTDNQGVPS